ncbi:nucleotide exchange factor GrpE [Nesterenkonia marinintestina]|uniref:nucleotide exchange factor GrpE n=1 Tax=Nesterenkonia marinintestina TaxID=2979865 RepID=UPI0028FC182C|nr:nucleotide exchange factor GrpE [Nesterenkonia sp. GX14115]
MADENRNPESRPGDEGSGAHDPVKDPLTQTEEIFEGLPVEDEDDSELGDPFSAESAAGTEPGAGAGAGEDGPMDEVSGAESELEAEIVEPGSEADAAAGAAAGEERSTSDLEAELQSDLQRVQAEYVNYRRRVERDRSVERERTVGQVLTALLPVLDDVYAARQAGDLADGPFAAIANKLEKVLGEHGLEVIDEVGAVFDPNVHEAIIQQPHPEVEADHVAAVLRAGYRQNDRVLRAAQVMVSTGPAE